MAVELLEDYDGKVLTIHTSGKLTAEDYHQFVPRIEQSIKQHGRIRVLFDMREFYGCRWSRHAARRNTNEVMKYGDHVRSVNHVRR